MPWRVLHGASALLLVGCAASGLAGFTGAVHIIAGLLLVALTTYALWTGRRRLLRLPAPSAQRLNGWFARVLFVAVPLIGVAGVALWLLPEVAPLRIRALLLHRAGADVVLPTLAAHVALSIALRPRQGR